MSEDIRVGGHQVESYGRGGGRDSHHSQRGSDVDLQEAIHKVMQDDHMKSEMKKLLT